MRDDHDLHDHLNDPQRLRALHDAALLDTPPEEGFDRLSRMAARMLGAPVALVSLVDTDRQFFKSCIGLPQPWADRRQTPLTHSFCQHNRDPDAYLLVADARADPRFRFHPAVADLQVVAYLGIPLLAPDREVLGSFCVIDNRPRDWQEDQIALLQELAGMVATEIHLRAEIARRRRAEDERSELARLNRRLDEEMSVRLRVQEEQRRLEARVLQDQKLESLGSLAGGVAHDFNNLLAVLLGSLEMAQGRIAVDRRGAELFARMQTAGRQASDLVRQLLAYAGRGRFLNEPCDCSAVVREMGDLLVSAIGRRARLELDLAEDLPPVEADPVQLRQLVMNPIINAAEALVEGDGRILVRTRCRELDQAGLQSPYLSEIPPPGRYVEIEVEDDGSGMDATARDRLFDPFFTTKAHGHGLGMAGVLGVVRAAGGSVQVASEPGRGTRIRFLLPAASVASDSGLHRLRDWSARGTVLVAARRPSQRMFASAALESAGLTVLEAADGDEADRLETEHHGLLTLVVRSAELAAAPRHRADPPWLVYGGDPARPPPGASACVPEPCTADEFLAAARELLDAPKPASDR